MVRKVVRSKGLDEYIGPGSSVRDKAQAGALPDTLTILEISELWGKDEDERRSIEQKLLHAVVAAGITDSVIPDERWTPKLLDRLRNKDGLKAEFDVEGFVAEYHETFGACEEAPPLDGRFFTVSHNDFSDFLTREGVSIENDRDIVAWGVPDSCDPAPKTLSDSCSTKESIRNVRIVLDEDGNFCVSAPGFRRVPIPYTFFSRTEREDFVNLVARGRVAGDCRIGTARQRKRRLVEKLKKHTGWDYEFFSSTSEKGVWSPRFRFVNQPTQDYWERQGNPDEGRIPDMGDDGYDG